SRPELDRQAAPARKLGKANLRPPSINRLRTARRGVRAGRPGQGAWTDRLVCAGTKWAAMCVLEGRTLERLIAMSRRTPLTVLLCDQAVRHPVKEATRAGRALSPRAPVRSPGF